MTAACVSVFYIGQVIDGMEAVASRAPARRLDVQGEYLEKFVGGEERQTDENGQRDLGQEDLAGDAHPCPLGIFVVVIGNVAHCDLHFRPTEAQNATGEKHDARERCAICDHSSGGCRA